MSEMEAAVSADLRRVEDVVSVRQQEDITKLTNPVGANMTYNRTQESQKLDLKKYKEDYVKKVGEILTSNQPAVDAHIKTDKLVYKPGDRMYIEVYLFDSFFKLPITYESRQYYPSSGLAYEDLYYPYYSSYLYATLQVLDQLDQSVYSTGSNSENSTISFTYDIPKDQTGGEYKLVVTSGSGRFADAVRHFRIREYEEQQLVIQAEFDKDSYKPGDMVEVALRVRTQDGAQFAVLPSFTYTIDFSSGAANNETNQSSQVVQNMTQTFLDSQGMSSFTFIVPVDTTRNEAVLFINVRYQSTLVPFTRTLSLVQPANIVIDFFPETNNYVLGVPNKVYYQAYSNNQRVNTIDLNGSMLLAQDSNSNELLTLSSNLTTEHLGRGYFEFVPELNKEYFFQQGGQVEAVQNASSLKRHSLNVSSQVGLAEFEISFSLTKNVLANNENLEVRLFTNQYMNSNDVYVLGVYNLEKAMYLAQLQFEANKSYIHEVKWQDFNVTNGGVLRVQLFRVLRPLIWYERFEHLTQGLQPNRFEYNPTLDLAMPENEEFSISSSMSTGSGSASMARDNTTGEANQTRKNISIRTQLENPLYEYFSIPFGEILFFKKPESRLDIQITTDKDIYMPGDLVQFQVRVSLSQDKIADMPQDSRRFFNTSIVGNETVNRQQSGGEGFYVSSVVSDDSVYRLVPQRQQPPSLPTMVLLERELYLTNFDFLNNDQYVDYMYPQANDSATQSFDEPSDKKLDLLLGVQGWRKGFFYPQVLEELTLVAKNQSYEDRYLMQRALAFKFQDFQPYRPYDYSYYGGSGAGVGRASGMSAAASGTGTGTASMAESMNLSTGAGGGSADSARPPAPTPPPVPGQLGAPQLVTGLEEENIGASQLTLTQKEQALWEFIKANRQCQAVSNTRYFANAQRLSFLSDIGGRYDMTDTVFYSTANYTKSGVYRGSFFLSDLVSQFRISANAFDNFGRLGFGSKLIISQKPFYINIQLPQMLVIGDRLQIPLQAYNNLDQALQARFSIMDYDDTALLVTMTQENDIVVLPPLGSSQNLTQANQLPVLTVEAQNFTQPLADAEQSQQQAIDDQAFIQIRGIANNVQGGQSRRLQDSLLKQFRVVTPGVAQLQQKGGLISNAPQSRSVATFTFTVPETVVLGTLELTVEVYPANYQALLEALRRIILQPVVCIYCYGPTTYAKALAVEAATASGGALSGSIDSGIISKAREDISKEYQELSRDVHDDGSYSVSSEGKPDLLATVQNLQVIDAVGNANVGIDKSSKDKTVDWVLSQRDEQGHFIIVPPVYNPKPQYLVDAFIVWILSDIGVEQSELQTTLNSLNDVATQQMSQGIDADLYFLGLQSATYYNFNQTDVAQRYADFLATQQGEDGALHQVTTFFSTETTRLSGFSEATAIATIAWENDFDRYAENIAKAVDYLVDHSYLGYYYYPTHSSILSLRAILEYLKTVTPIDGEGDFILRLDNSTTLVSQQPFSYNDSAASRSFGSDYYSYYDYYGYYPRNVMQTISFDTSAFIGALIPGSTHTLALSVENYIPRNASSDDFTSQYSMSFAYDDTQPVEKVNRTSISFSATRSNRSGTNASQGAESQIGDIATYNLVVSSLQGQNGTGVGLVIVKFRPPSCYQMNFDLIETLRRNGVISMYEFKQSNTEVWMYIEGILAGQSTQIVIELVQIFNGICQERPQEAVEYYNPQEPLYAFP